MKNIRIEEVGDISSTYPYLEVFLMDTTIPFLEIGISDNKQLYFKYYPSEKILILSVEEWEHILKTAKEFLPKALSDEDTFNIWNSQQ